MMIVNEEIKLNKRQPTWNYILNDLALYSLMTKVIHSEEATNQEKFDFMYQIKLLQQENARLKEERKQIKEYVEKCNFDNAEILFDFGSEYCYIDDFKEHILEILKEN